MDNEEPIEANIQVEGRKAWLLIYVLTTGLAVNVVFLAEIVKLLLGWD